GGRKPVQRGESRRAAVQAGAGGCAVGAVWAGVADDGTCRGAFGHGASRMGRRSPPLFRWLAGGGGGRTPTSAQRCARQSRRRRTASFRRATWNAQAR